MNLDSYIAIQKQIGIYRDNLRKLEERIAAHGGYTFSPLEVQNQYDSTKQKINDLVGDLHEIERRMIHEISVIRKAFVEKEQQIEQLRSEVNKLRQASLEKDKRIEELSWIPLNLKNLTPEERRRAYEEIYTFGDQIASLRQDLEKDYGANRRRLTGTLRQITELYKELLVRMKKYYD
jgi:DNA repair exonuclease SbcCD ATPase subunit